MVARRKKLEEQAEFISKYRSEQNRIKKANNTITNRTTFNNQNKDFLNIEPNSKRDYFSGGRTDEQ